MKIYSSRKIILFCPSFYNYRAIIKKELEFLGAKVFSYDERPSNSTIFKILLRLKLYFLIEHIISKYYENIILENNAVTDVFFINAEAINRNILKKMRLRYKNASFTLYMWDSIRNKKNILEILDMFDNAYSFDPDDCKKENSLSFEPLFYNKNFEKRNGILKYDISFVGSIHSDRLSIIKKLFKIRNVIGKFFLYSPSKVFSFIKVVSQNKLNINDLKLISHSKIDLSSVSEIFFSSKAIVDIQHPNQRGLTMRTFEVLGSGRKLITTNSDIKNYEFYNENNILIINRKNINGDDIKKFIDTEYIFSEDILKYRVDNWLRRILC
ncbi:hypothetical protein [Photobacterium leiognathi]|uniref:hypothetical protein n=1 Tax=Photobacterium leiognathi TaxID=553611 RepID=UPI002981A8DD|nr:hypothetical protein [Photobacterium leiognathi]